MMRLRPRRLRSLALAAVLLVVVSACGDDDATTPSDGSSTTASGDSASWCDVFDELQSSEDFGSVDAAGAPAELQAPLRELAEAADLHQTDPPEGTVTRLFEANAVVETWGYDHCGGDHPFCTVWITAEQSIAVNALTDSDVPTAHLLQLLDELTPVLSRHAPPELSDDLDTVLSYTRAPSDEDEPAAEAATAALDAWARSERCDGAPPEADERAAP